MKKFCSMALAVLLVMSMALASFGEIAPWLDLGRSTSVSGNVKRSDGSTVKVSGTAYPQQAQGMFDRINEIRRAAGLKELIKDPYLVEAAQQRALEISVTFSHTRPDGTKCFTASPYLNGENVGIAMADYHETTGGYPGADGFMESPSHRAAILDPDFTSLQTFCFERDNQLYWVQLFGIAKEVNGTVTSTPKKGTSSNSNTTAPATPKTPSTKAPATKAPATNTAPKSPTTTTGVLSEADMVAKAKAATPNKAVRTISVNNASAITEKTLKAMRAATGTDAVVLKANTVEGKKVVGQIILNPDQFKTDTATINLGVELNSTNTQKVKNLFAKNFSNKTVAIHFTQAGSFGATVKIAVLADLSELNTQSLVFYHYDNATGKYTKIATPNYSIDKNGYLYFSTDKGGDIVITDKNLVK